MSVFARVIPLGILINFFVGFLACVLPCYEVLSVGFVGFSTRYTLGNSYQFLCRSLHALYHWEFLSISLSVSWHAFYPAMRSYQLALSALARVIPLGILINFFVGFLACVIPCYEVLSVGFVGFSTRYTIGNSYQFLCRSLHALYHWEFLSISLSVSWHALYPAMRSYQLALSALARVIPLGILINFFVGLARVIPLGILINFFVGLCTRYTIGNSYQFLCRFLGMRFTLL